LNPSQRVFVLGIDGVPHSLVQRFADAGVMPNMARLMRAGWAAQIDSVLPTVSNVAWACFQTGKNPGKFDIFGFAEVDARLQIRLPNGSHLRSETLEEIASRAGKRVVSLGIPTSYPPRKVNGLVVSGFLAPSLEKGVYPLERLALLKSLGYQLDIDPRRAREDLTFFKRQLLEVFDGRRRAAEALLESEPWDLFIMHVMETDRINHFLWRQWETGDAAEAAFFEDFYRRVDAFVGWLDERLGERDTLAIVSDHGFCSVRAEVQINRWLMREGYLRVQGDPKDMFAAISDDTVAFGLVPGRIHIFRSDAYDRGGVPPQERDKISGELADKLRSWTDPETGQLICKRVLKREEAFSGPYIRHAPDVIVDPHDGYDFKAALTQGEIFTHSPITGMHTYHDASLYLRGRRLTAERRSITDLTRSVLDILGVPVPPDMDSRGVLA